MTVATVAERKLGKNQSEFMALMRRHRGQWRRGGTWVWKAPSETLRMLDALERRGYVGRDPDSGLYRMTPAGRGALREWEAGGGE